MADSTFISRVVLANYKSIGACTVELGPLTFLVGRNGAGKSNFLDALRFVADSLRYSLEHALRDRGGIAEVRRRSGGHPNNFGIRLDLRLPNGSTGHYAFKIGAQPPARYEVQTEECVVRGPEALSSAEARFVVATGRVVNWSASGAPVPPAPASDRLYLVSLSGFSEFRPVYDALSRMGFYNLNPERIRDLQSPDPGELLARDGSNLASVLAQLKQNNEPAKRLIEEYLAKVVPGMQTVDPIVIGPKETLEFRQTVAGAKHGWQFLANNMSDGTLRALGVLVSLFQSSDGANRVPLVGIEEPEVALHPGAANILLDGLRDASEAVQVIVTSHSADLLDNKELPMEWILAVEAIEGNTRIARVGGATKEALRQQLYTAGELLRQDKLRPDPAAVPRARQLTLFDLAQD